MSSMSILQYNTLWRIILFLVSVLGIVSYGYATQPHDISHGYTIYIQPVALVQGEKVFLHDIAHIKAPLSDTLMQHIKDTPLWNAPHAIGEKIVFSEIAIRKKMKEVLGKDALFCRYPQTITIQRGGSIVYKKEIEQRVREVLLPRLEQEYTASIEIDEMKIPEHLFIADPKSTLHVEIKRLALPKSTLSLVVTNPMDRKEQQIPLSVTVHAYKQGICAKEYIERYTQLDDVVEPCTYNASLITGAFMKEKDAIYRTKKSIPQGTLLLQADVEVIPTIVKGAVIELIYHKNSIRLSTKATALTDAHIGSMIRVQPSYSKKSIYATVLDEHTVAIQ